MPFRRPHSKSRFGCLSCKKRRIKCGEELPSCQNCTKRHLDCTYSQSRTFDTGTSSQERSTSGGSPANCEQQNGTQPLLPSLYGQDPINKLGIAATRLQELQLMFHYITATCETMTHGPEDMEVWRTAIPLEAVKHEFLMDGLLALSSLHFAFQNPDLRWTYTEIAVQYQNSGLRRFNIALGGITEDNCHALFAFSLIITILAFALPTVSFDKPVLSHSESLVSIFELLHGVGLITRTTEESIKNGKFEALFRHAHLDTMEVAPDDEVASAMLKLRERAGNIAKYVEPDRYQVYISSIESLEINFRCVAIHQYLGGVVAWPVTVSEKLLAFFKQGDPMAQLIFIHYGVLLLHIHHRWWGRDFGVRLIESLTASICAIDSEWACWTEWATRTAALVT
ncbi:hypothetical protein K469DRAFT_636060 [Zopfia rhizophila CBS 207.26]|uniref:Zn(2)-C6 fungal-type domain-containing protein n=1 Tax=Zopfia rhizophila CBS 207.26 TaxID=1314779 RepID=A0A6A6DXQ6_9PEZI|nr:hypothetical protein K469DRAFT_636060 [Zopfia rhizophila CBS 207.26]